MMKRYAAAAGLVLVALVASTGCHRIGCRGCGPCQAGCRPGPIGWQRGGTHYQGGLSHNYAGGHNHNADYRNQPGGGSGVVAPQVGYPYYSTRGPRDFFVDDPPTIGR